MASDSQSHKPKKSLGQNFLTDKNIQRKLISSYNLKSCEHVLEIGAGYGELTKLIAGHAAFVYALEVDPALCKVLRDNTKSYPNVKIINQDILKFDLSRYFENLKSSIKVVGNIPYYITSPIIEHLLKYRAKIETIFITVQKEFAKRMAANAGSKEYGSFSCFVQYYTIPKMLFFIKKGSFFPVPKVDSCVLEFKVRQVPAVKVYDESLFFKIIRAGFNQRRKTLRNSLDGIVPRKELLEFFRKTEIGINTRPEDLALQDFARLANSL